MGRAREGVLGGCVDGDVQVRKGGEWIGGESSEYFGRSRPLEGKEV